MVPAVVHETRLLQRQVDALERENEHLKELLSTVADGLAERDRVIASQAARLSWLAQRPEQFRRMRF